MIQSTEKQDVARETVELLNDYAMELREQGKFESARIVLTRALGIDPDLPELNSNIGCVLMNLGRQEEALKFMRRACRLKPNDSKFWGNIGVLYGTMRMYPECEDAFERCIKIAEAEGDEEKVIGAKWDRSLQRLEQGNWHQGWDDYDYRILRKDSAKVYQKYPVPLWSGEDINGKTLYVQTEQGIGDVLAYSRFLAEVHKRYPDTKIYFGCSDRLVSLLWDFSSFIRFMPSGIPWPQEIDVATYLCSLPRILGITQDTLPADPGLVLSRVHKQHEFNLQEPYLPSLKVGIAWTGNPKQNRNHERSIPFEQLLTLAEDPNVCLYSFQVGPGEEDIDRLGALQVVYPLGETFKEEGLVTAASAMLKMDVIITVCTSTAHLAGVLNVPCWVLLCQDPYWLWTREGQTSKWYPNTRLFRQYEMGNWDRVLGQVKTELKVLAKKKGL